MTEQNARIDLVGSYFYKDSQPLRLLLEENESKKAELNSLLSFYATHDKKPSDRLRKMFPFVTTFLKHYHLPLNKEKIDLHFQLMIEVLKKEKLPYLLRLASFDFFSAHTFLALSQFQKERKTILFDAYSFFYEREIAREIVEHQPLDKTSVPLIYPLEDLSSVFYGYLRNISLILEEMIREIRHLNSLHKDARDL